MDIERLKKQFGFILEIDKEKQIGRQTYLSDGDGYPSKRICQ